MDHRRRIAREDPGAAEGVIVRVWSARITAEKVPTYVEFFGREVRPVLERIPGFLSARVLATSGEVVVQSEWASMDAIRAFAGDDPTLAVVEPAAAALFTEYDRTARHFEVIDG